MTFARAVSALRLPFSASRTRGLAKFAEKRFPWTVGRFLEGGHLTFSQEGGLLRRAASSLVSAI